ncbi:MAG: 30S ribosomal protein S6 [Phycisphaerae bacterium]|nr:30S ribosomal protein S6 [Phycisphaerae bacterium]
MKTYEGMFLFDPAVTAEWEQAKAELDRLMGRAGAEVIVSGKWDERRLAYEIGGHKRAMYVLAYFRAEAGKIGGLERDAQLSEAIIRCMVLRADHVTEAAMKEALAGPARVEVVPRDGQRREGASPDAVGREEVVSAIADLDGTDAKE